MAKKRTKVPRAIRNDLFVECGGACSNPGCPNTVLEMHHIQEWAVYETHDRAHMINLCPACHVSITRGELQIDDEVIYEWKAANSQRWAGILVPPASSHRLLAGSIAFESSHPFAVFQWAGQSLTFTLDPTGQVLTLSGDSRDRLGNLLLSLQSNTVTHIANGIQPHVSPGWIRFDAAEWQTLLPTWAYTQLLRMAATDSGSSTGLRRDIEAGIPLFELRVIKSGVVRVGGIWAGNRSSIVIASGAMTLHGSPTHARPVALVGGGTLMVDGPDVLFAFQRTVA